MVVPAPSLELTIQCIPSSPSYSPRRCLVHYRNHRPPSSFSVSRANLVHFGLMSRPQLEPEADDVQHFFEGCHRYQRKFLDNACKVTECVYCLVTVVQFANRNAVRWRGLVECMSIPERNCTQPYSANLPRYERLRLAI